MNESLLAGAARSGNRVAWVKEITALRDVQHIGRDTLPKHLFDSVDKCDRTVGTWFGVVAFSRLG